MTSGPRHPVWSSLADAVATICYAFQHHKKGRNERLFDTMLFKHFDLMTISVRNAKAWIIFWRKNQLNWIIISWKTTSWLLRCKLIRWPSFVEWSETIDPRCGLRHPILRSNIFFYVKIFATIILSWYLLKCILWYLLELSDRFLKMKIQFSQF